MKCIFNLLFDIQKTWAGAGVKIYKTKGFPIESALSLREVLGLDCPDCKYWVALEEDVEPLPQLSLQNYDSDGGGKFSQSPTYLLVLGEESCVRFSMHVFK